MFWALIMNRVHASWSFGFFAAGIISTLIAIGTFGADPSLPDGAARSRRCGPDPWALRSGAPPQTLRASVAGGSLSGVYQPSPLNSQLVHESDGGPRAGTQAVTRFFADPFVER